MNDSKVKTEARIRAEIERQGLKATPHGAAWRVHGPGVDVLVASLEKLGPEDLKFSPALARRFTRNQRKETA